MASCAALALAVPTAGAALGATPAPGDPDGAHVVISEAYLVGGSAGQPFTNKFVELYNPTGSAVDLSSWSVQYKSSSGASFSGITRLSGSIPAGGHYLVQQGSNGAAGAALPTPDAVGATSLGGSSGVVALVASQTLVANPAKGSHTADPAFVDLLGYGAADVFEVAPGPAGQGTGTVGALERTAFGNDNSADFTFSAEVTPENSAGDGTDPDPEPTQTATPTPTQTTTPGDVVPIAQIQGSGERSPLVGQTVTTRGVVTAAYPTGGLNGVTIQTEGTGGDLDLAEHTASDAIFVYSSAAAAALEIGDHVEVTGKISEYDSKETSTSPANGSLTEISPAAGGWTVLAEPAEAVKPATVTWPASDAQRESLEEMLLAPQGDFTVTDNYSTNYYGSIGLAAGSSPLVQPTSVGRPGSAEATAAAADNAARAIVLDDGATTNFNSTKTAPLPYLTKDAPVRVGAAVTFTTPVVLDQRYGTWNLQPLAALTPAVAGTVQPATFEDTREAQPEDVGGDLTVGTFNVLNYFTTTGDELTGCTSYKDRFGNPVTVSGGCDARGAWDAENLDRQETKIVAAISALGADVVSLEEIENSAAFGKDRDTALGDLVDALNAADGAGTWAFVASPDALPSSEDVIRTAFVYRTATAEPVGDSTILVDDPAFDNAREPLAQTFRPAGGTAAQDVVVIANHFKSKGSGSGADADQGDGQGASNASRVAQATALTAFADDVAAAAGTEKVLLVGDFNSYAQEDPMVVLHEAGYTDLGATTGKETYQFDGMVGSLDHVLASPAATAAVAGTDVWNINSVEPIANEYSRYDYNVVNLYDETPFRSSDHDPILVGLDLAADTTTTIDLVSINDFHGRIQPYSNDGTTNPTLGFAGTVEALKAQNPDGTAFVSAGDNIGASLFASSLQQDQPTIDVLNALGLATSAVGNHEFDQGFSDLTGRVTDAADWSYLGANVYEKGTTTPALPEFDVIDVDGVQVGFVGVVTQETPTLVTPAGIADLDFGDPVDALNRVTDDLLDGDDANGEADVVVALVHEGAGAGTPDGASIDDEVAAGGAFAELVEDTDPRVAAFFTGHTHKQYAWDAPITGTDRTRPVVQTGSYGEYVGHISLTVDTASGDVVDHTAENVAASKAPWSQLVASYPVVGEVKTIVDDALAEAAVIGSKPVGSVSADITTAFTGGKYVDGVYQGPGPAASTGRDDRMSESTLGNLVANSLRETLADPDRGGADFGVVNPGGLRNELFYAPDGTVTFAEANAVLPFVNNLWTVTLTGEQVVEMLEQQWQTNADGTRPSRPYLALGLSDNVSYTVDTADGTAAPGGHVTSVTIDGEPIDPAGEYRVATFSFLATGGDNFRVFTQGTDAKDSGLVDRDAWMAYLGDNPDLAPSFARTRAVVPELPGDVEAGGTTSVTVSSLDLTSIGSPANTGVSGYLVARDDAFDADAPGQPVGTAPVTSGSATLDVTVPTGTAAGEYDLWVVASPSGTTVRVPLTVTAPVVVDTYQPGTVYVAGDEVVYQGVVYRALWWTQGTTPGSTSWGAWVEVGPADGSVPVCGVAWTSSMVYTGGEVVSHDGHRWSASWWTRNQEPGASPWGPWKDLGACPTA
ncbi:5'-nucleotidase [Sediminihabitans luteus]|uniref:5'-nucleotidase n=1 Tax=Sediminihabitans luteus TaxID=1138585 RepID=A0A2M9D0U7_9CELL|nr:ExeM/NucH family extracellular endonuclease [Sediminihabitans luteus]PJJ77608.1 5'-nucleotidase [Sediminihabitans luteus]GII98508.1 multifunctional nuclease/2',3'-cyclic-nucleotide 2'-phosphodiesterase/5'-nucleotidase/3'-nucleotidase [Sediminihabitans luteus]